MADRADILDEYQRSNERPIAVRPGTNQKIVETSARD